MKKNPFVSVVINCFNGEKYLATAIDSIYAQDYANWEIVFWDNASTDASAQIIKKYDSKIRYFRGDTTIPLGAARNRALLECKGEYVGFLDCDDTWLPKKLSTQIRVIQSGNYALCYGGCIEQNELGETIRTIVPKFSSGYIFADLLKQFDIGISAALLRRSDLHDLKLNFDDSIRASEEYCLFMQLAAQREICVVDEPVVTYLVRKDSLTTKTIDRWALEREYTLDLIKTRHPDLVAQYAGEFAEAQARAKYYRARLFMHQNDKKAALAELKSISGQDYRYMMLYLTLLLSADLWHLIHREDIKRFLTSRVFGYAKAGT